MDVSVVLPFCDHEDEIGTSCRRIARALAGRHLDFEILAVDEGSSDNSRSILALLRGEIPQLHLVTARGRNSLERGAVEARGRALWLVSQAALSGPLSAFGRAYQLVASSRCDMAVVGDRFAVCHRARSLAVIRGGSTTSFRRLARIAESHGLSVQRTAVAVRSTAGGHRGGRIGGPAWHRLLPGFGLARVGVFLRS